MRFLPVILLLIICHTATAQTFELSGIQESYKGSIGEVVHAPLRLKNTSDKAITLVIKRSETQIGSSQRNYFCPDNNCLESRMEDYTVKIEPGQTLQNFSIGLEAGLAEGFSSVKYSIYNKSNPSESTQFELNFSIETRREKGNVYSSQFITINDIYPNPVSSIAHIDYQLHKDRLKTKIVVHNILGNPLAEYDLSFLEKSVKIDADQLKAGIYFYTLYINNEGVMTRKLIVNK